MGGTASQVLSPGRWMTYRVGLVRAVTLWSFCLPCIIRAAWLRALMQTGDVGRVSLLKNNVC